MQNAPRTQQNGNQRNLIIAAIGAAVVITVALMLVSLNSTKATFGEAYFADIPVESFEGGYIIGDPAAPVTIVEFADYLCSHCQDYKPTADRFLQEYVATGKARWEFRLLPTAGGETTRYAGNLAYCAAAEGKHWGYVNEVMFELAQTGGLQRNPALTVSERLGVSVDTLLRCVKDATYVNDDVRMANNVGVSATPTVFYRLNGGSLNLIDNSNRGFDGLAALVASAGQ